MKIALITRYSVRNKTFMGRAGIDSELERSKWLRHRQKLFHQICLPAIRRQTRLPDVWMLLFAEGDEAVAREVIPADCPWIVPIFVPQALSGGEQFIEFINSELLNCFKGVTDDLLVSRMDSDDCVADFYFSRLIEVAESVVSSSMDEVFIFTKGVRWNGLENRVIRYNSSPFLATRGALRANGRAWVNNPLFNHSDAHLRAHHPISGAMPAWLQVIHGNNISNSLDITKDYLGTLSEQELMTTFGIDSKVAIPVLES